MNDHEAVSWQAYDTDFLAKNTFKSDFCGCLSYRDHAGSCLCIPYFCPMSLCGTCCVVGRIVTILRGEEPCCCEMSGGGWLYCCFSNILCGPPGYMLINCALRNQISNRYNIDDDDCLLLKCCFYPCSFFQMLVTMNELKNENISSNLL